MKIYFAGAICGGREDIDLYVELIKHLNTFGEVLTEHVGDQALTSSGEEGITDSEIYSRDMGWLQAAEVIVAEVTTPSLGVGYELASAENLGKRILCLFRSETERRLSAMVAGNTGMIVRKYKTFEDAKKEIDRFFTEEFRISK